MKYNLLKLLLILGFILTFQPKPVFADSFSEYIKENTSGGINIRFRDELWSTFEKEDGDFDRTYNFLLVRARGHVDFKMDNWLFHIAAQAVTAYSLPNNAAFGPGGIYFAASGRDRDPGNFQFLEGFIKYKDPSGFYIMGGRIPIREGAEVVYKDDKKLTWVIKKRIAERLIGTWDWTNVGRRFDGGTLGYQNDVFDINFFGAYVTAGGFDFDDGLESELNDTIVAGGSATIKKDVVLPGTQLKVFNYFYFDDRDPAVTLTGDDIKINTLGANLAGAYNVGSGEVDLMLWFAFQFGEFGDLDQNAFAFIAETGYQMLDVAWKPWLRVGVAYASGDDDSGDSDNGNFFNMVPTNHKWYGYQDVNAFSNLINAYTQLILKPHNRVNLALDGHLFFLADDETVSIGGSGPFNNDVFGYVFRQPLAGEDIEGYLGSEIDSTVSIKALDFLTFQAGYSIFIGGSGIEAIFDSEDVQHWFYTQAVINFNIGK